MISLVPRVLPKQTAKPELVGASVFGHNEIYTQLKAFRTRLISSGTSRRM